MWILWLLLAVLIVGVAKRVIDVYNLSVKLSGREELLYLPTRRENILHGTLFFLFFVVLMISYIYLIDKYGGLLLFFTPSGSEHGQRWIDPLMIFNLIIINIAFFVFNAALFYFVWRYKDSKSAYFFPGKTKLEVVIIVVVGLGLAVIILMGLSGWKDIMMREPQNPLVIEVFGRQFQWIARYSGGDNTLGRAGIENMSPENPLGIDFTDEHSTDDIVVSDTLCLPVGREIQFRFRSSDVIHSAFIPHLRVQMNVVPGLLTTFNFKPVATTTEMRKMLNDSTFDYVLLCNKICGSGHFNMQLKVVVVSPEEFAMWLSRRKDISGEQVPIETAKKIAYGKGNISGSPA